MGAVKIVAYICDRCGHGPWLRNVKMSRNPEAKADDVPKICPRCKSPNWNKGPKKKAGE